MNVLSEQPDESFLEPENLPALPERLGIRMLEGDSIDRVIEGLKMAADGCLHLHYHRDNREDPLWQINASAFDALRTTCAQMARRRASDTTETADPRGARMPQGEAYQRVYEGLKMAGQAARQIATGHRGDLTWSKIARHLETQRDRLSSLVRTRRIQAAAPSILLPN